MKSFGSLGVIKEGFKKVEFGPDPRGANSNFLTFLLPNQK